MMELRFYYYDEWDVVQAGNYDPDERTYVDNDGQPITGILENFSFFTEGDSRNHRKVINGKPVYE